MPIELPWSDKKVAELLKSESETAAALADVLEPLLSSTGPLVLGPQDPIPPGTPEGTVIYRTAT